MVDVVNSNKRIIKNTLMLYMRMLLMMGVSLYTSRVVLRTLGVDDFGIYNVVGGVITMLSFFTSSLSGAGSRFVTFALGKDDEEEQKRVYSAVMVIHYLLAFLIIIIGETVGLWFVYNKLVIPETRMNAALWVYHCSIVTTVIAVISAPYNALIIAHEKMDVFAYVSIVEAVLKLAIVYMLICIPYDKLIIYALLLMFVQLIIRMIYNIYCNRKFEESHAKLRWDSGLIKKISIYAGWTVNGNLAVVGYTQGINILLNNDLEYMHSLVVRSSKFGFYLVLFLAFPIVLCVNPILKIWLGIVPEHTNTFVIIMLVAGLVEPLKVALINAIHATGDIKKFQLYEGTSLLTVLPIAYILLKFFKISPEAVMLVYLIVQLFTQYIRMRIVLAKINMTGHDYFVNVLQPILYVLPFTLVPFFLLPKIDNISFCCLVFCVFVLLIYVLVCIFLLGLNQKERRYILSLVVSKFRKK